MTSTRIDHATTGVLDRGTVLEARGVTKSFGGVQALRGVDLSVGQGEIVALIGPNGSGKSTLLACISRDIDVDQGAIHFEGRDITRISPYRVARIGISRTFQNVRVFPELTGWENALLSRQWAGEPWWRLARPAEDAVRERARHLFALTEMSGLASEYAGNLSGGQRRLLEMVMALMAEPRLILLDEATSAINPTLVQTLSRHIRTINEEEGVSFLIVEHNTQLIFELAHRIVVLNNGEELAVGTADDIRNNQEVVDAYLGA